MALSNYELQHLIAAYERNPSLLFCDDVVQCLKEFHIYREFVRSVAEHDRSNMRFTTVKQLRTVLADIEKEAKRIYVPVGNKGD